MRGGRSRPPRIRCRPRVDRIGGVRGVSHPLRDVARRTRVVQEAQSVVSIGQATAGEVPDRVDSRGCREVRGPRGNRLGCGRFSETDDRAEVLTASSVTGCEAIRDQLTPLWRRLSQAFAVGLVERTTAVGDPATARRSGNRHASAGTPATKSRARAGQHAVR